MLAEKGGDDSSDSDTAFAVMTAVVVWRVTYYTTNNKTIKTHGTEDPSNEITREACTDIAVSTTHKYFTGFHFPEISSEKCLSMIESRILSRDRADG